MSTTFEKAGPTTSRDSSPTSSETAGGRSTKEEAPQDHEERRKNPAIATSFAPGTTGDLPAPSTNEKMLEEGYGAGGNKAQRTFSRRDPSRAAAGDDTHIFGGDLQRMETELKLERFISQAGKDQVLVHWEGENDPENPKTWSFAYRWALTLLSGLLVLNSTFTSSAPSGIIEDLIRDLGMSTEVATLTIAIFVAAYCVGPLFWGPFSERVGRKPALCIALAIYTCFNVGCALARNTGSLLVFRFLSGAFASSPLVVTGGLIADVHDAKQRGLALALFALAPFAGPALGPIVSGAIAVTGTDWRWLFWTCALFSGGCFALTLFGCHETFAPVLLVRKAKRIRKETGDNRYVAPLELTPLEAKTLLKTTIFKPFAILFAEPMLIAITVYISFVYGIIYLLFEAYPFVFQGIYHFHALESGLTFIPLFLGGVIGTLVYAFFENPRYARMVDASPTGRVPPEQRLTMAMIGGPLMVISFFWFGWTCYPSVSYWAPLMAALPLGLSVQFIFLSLFTNVVDSYLGFAASALAANTVCRSAFGAGFPLFAAQMYQRLGAHWASTLLGCIALLLAPVPFVLFKYGPKLRSMSKYAATE